MKMTVRTTTLGGSDWVDGETLTAADLNDTVEDMGAQTTEYEVAKWNLIETLSPSAATTITSTGTLPVYDEYKVRVKLSIPTFSGSPENLLLQLNGDTGSNYYTMAQDGGGTNASFLLAAVNTTQNMIYGEVALLGKTAAVSSGTLPIVINMIGTANYCRLGGHWIGGNATQITSMTFLRGGSLFTFTGSIKIYGRNF
jgi:hypothetical protein